MSPTHASVQGLDTTDPIPSWRLLAEVDLAVEPSAVEPTAGAEPGTEPGTWGIPVGTLDGKLVGVDESWHAPVAAGFTGAVGQTLLAQQADGSGVVLYGIGDLATAGTAELRSGAAAFARAVPRENRLGLALPDTPQVTPAQAAQVVVEGVLLSRYDPGIVRSSPPQGAGVPVESITLRAPTADNAEARTGARRGLVLARANALARDLANCPPSILTAERMAGIATELAAETGLTVEVSDRAALIELGCGGLLGVNAGSVDPPAMIRLSYTPSPGGEQVSGRLALVGKGIMYDSGGISLKPADLVHATMKNDMSGAAAILAAMAVLRDLGCTTEVTGYLMCTDNMPSGTATKLGDVLRIRGGRTVEVLNADAEGRLVMADAMVLAAESRPDAIVDIATLTGACLRALGAEIAGVFGNDQDVVDQVLDASAATDEATWQLPLARRYRSELDSETADIANMGGANGASIHAALFLAEFVGDVPWAHIDIAGTAQAARASGWLTAGCTGYGARLLAELATGFTR